MISFGPVSHRFAYFYGDAIPEYTWPSSVGEVPPDVTYFCYDLHRGDTAERRLNGRGRVWTETPAALPIEWEAVGMFPVDPIQRSKPDTIVVVGRFTTPRRMSPLFAKAEAGFFEDPGMVHAGAARTAMGRRLEIPLRRLR